MRSSTKQDNGTMCLAKHPVTLGNFTPFTANFWRINRKKRLALSSLYWLLPPEKIFTLYSPERRDPLFDCFNTFKILIK